MKKIIPYSKILMVGGSTMKRQTLETLRGTGIALAGILVGVAGCSYVYPQLLPAMLYLVSANALYFCAIQILSRKHKTSTT